MSRTHSKGGQSGSPDKKSPQTQPIGPDLPELQRARSLWQNYQFDEALALFESAAQKNPDNLLALIDASRALGTRYEIHRAEQILNQLLNCAPDRPNILHLAGQSFRMIFRPERAIACFERALELSQDVPDTYLELAVLHERRHQLEKAQVRITQCLERFPDYDAARLFLGRLLRRTGELSRACGLFQKLASKPASHPFIQAQAWAELAQIHDSQESFNEALNFMHRSKSILLKHEGDLHQQSQNILQQLLDLNVSLTQEDFTRWRSEYTPEPPYRTGVLTSFPRSGTTLLEQILDAHSQIISSDERECFARDIFPELWRTPHHPRPTREGFHSVSPARMPILRKRYWAAMEATLQEPIESRTHLDKNPTLTLVLSGYLRLFPQTKILFAVRDPRDILISCFLQYLPLNTNSVCFLTPERTAQRLSADLQSWFNLRDKMSAPWIELRYEDTVHRLEDQARKTLHFLELPWEASILNYREQKQTKAVGSPTYEAVQKPLYTRSIGRWRHYSKLWEPSLPLLQPLLKKWGYE